ncbi:hypothetical protein MNBD_IGNAVI01-419 [hydrothermal vent metagenome]|uniref:Periplasmic protein n=1 Tax=hydrothermal vent metagenome TaxID=652676 RepID=A0A3B1C1N6_9ZZZZ
MNKIKSINRPPIIIGLAIVFLIGMSYIPEGITIFGVEIKKVDILEDLRNNSAEEKLEENKNEQDSLRSLNNENRNANLASVSLNASLDVSESIGSFIDNELAKYVNAKRHKTPTFKNHPLEGNLEQLKYFFEALGKSKTSQVRVAHFGDSALEGDLVTAYLRNKFQQRYGGKGVGFLPITSEDISFRETTKIRFSDDWTTASITGGNPEDVPVGIAGKVFINSAGSWVKYETVPKFRAIRNFDVAKIFYNNAKNSSTIKYSLNGSAEKSLQLIGGSRIKEFVIERKNSTSLKLDFPSEKTAYFYGVSLESKTGVYIDNFPLRGNSGIDLMKIPENNLQEFDSLMNYKLVILEFGLNILRGRKTNFSKYEKDMVDVINEFKMLFPRTSFLLIGVHDKCIKRKKDFITDPAIKKLVNTQKRIAVKTNSAFWNLFEAMGGENSMADWVNANPPLAYSDYIHFNTLGTKEEAEMLFKTIMDAKN